MAFGENRVWIMTPSKISLGNGEALICCEICCFFDVFLHLFLFVLYMFFKVPFSPSPPFIFSFSITPSSFWFIFMISWNCPLSYRLSFSVRTSHVDMWGGGGCRSFIYLIRCWTNRSLCLWGRGHNKWSDAKIKEFLRRKVTSNQIHTHMEFVIYPETRFCKKWRNV